MAIFNNSTAFKEVSQETKDLVKASEGIGKLARRDPSMYGDHHKCNKCDVPAKYIAQNTHWCKYCLDTVNYPHLAGMSQEERDALRDENLSKVKGAKLVTVGSMGTKVGF